MSKASEWAAHQSTRPAFQLEKNGKAIRLLVSDDGWLHIRLGKIGDTIFDMGFEPGEGLKMSNWIIDTFGDAA